MSEFYIGLMSGTSLDGVDVALCEIDDASCKLIASYEHPFAKALKEEILTLLANKTTLKAIGTLDVKLGKLFADAINTLIKREKLLRENIKAIGLHGQTLWHEPNAEYPFSMQLGNANVVAAETNIDVVSDFRGTDIANGGEGAPFAPALHQFLFHSSCATAVVNIGGMSNITLIDGDALSGYDIGCGNVLMDTYISLTQGKAYDKEGAFAKSGEVKQELLREMLADEYFQKEPPKSTGREYFNTAWLEKYLSRKANPADIQRTLLELTAVTISQAINSSHATKAIICGGGAKNTFLMQRLQTLCKSLLQTSDANGINADFLEAMLFAWLAYKRVHKQLVTLKDVTGAKKNTILGAIYAKS
jgi:anhydro-N-acetylmuramic acid kinase